MVDKWRQATQTAVNNRGKTSSKVTLGASHQHRTSQKSLKFNFQGPIFYLPADKAHVRKTSKLFPPPHTTQLLKICHRYVRQGASSKLHFPARGKLCRQPETLNRFSIPLFQPPSKKKPKKNHSSIFRSSLWTKTLLGPGKVAYLSRHRNLSPAT